MATLAEAQGSRSPGISANNDTVSAFRKARGKRGDSTGPFTLRWIMVHMIGEYARHNGHADLLRERIDGFTGS